MFTNKNASICSANKQTKAASSLAITAIFTLLTMLSVPTHAASQGLAGAESTARMNITVNILARADIQSETRQSLAPYTHRALLATSLNTLCIPRDGISGHVVTASGAGYRSDCHETSAQVSRQVPRELATTGRGYMQSDDILKLTVAPL